jgi:hypothetical protein
MKPVKCCVWKRLPGKTKHYAAHAGEWSTNVNDAYIFDMPSHAIAFLLGVAKSDAFRMDLDYGVEAASGTSDVLVCGPSATQKYTPSEPGKALCYSCVYRGDLPGDCHSHCKNQHARVTANQHGIDKGWFFHPFNFDPVWLTGCTGYVKIQPKADTPKGDWSGGTCHRCHAPVDMNPEGLCQSCLDEHNKGQ